MKTTGSGEGTPGSILDLIKSKWADEGWDPTTIDVFRMDGTDGDPDEEDPDDSGDEGEEDPDPDTTKGEKFDEARAKKTIETQRASEKRLKAEVATLRKEMKEIKDKDLPEKDRQIAAAKDLEARAEAAERALQKATVRTTALEAATKLGFKDPTLAYRLLDHDDVDWDDDQPSNITNLLKDILKESPYLKGGRKAGPDQDDDEDGADGGAGRSGGGKGWDMNKHIRSQAGR